MAILRIERSNEYANRVRKINIKLNGKTIGQISNGESKEFEIPEGTHSLKATIDWCSSNQVSFGISGNEKKTFRLTSFAKHSKLGVFATIYYISFGANRFLRLTEKRKK